ncbi:MAG TPA: hypothetical protein VJ900_00575 [Patescibacteria group bacterium]|nr:hypothetical protein [Patescibacteria group bacterium]
MTKKLMILTVLLAVFLVMVGCSGNKYLKRPSFTKEVGKTWVEKGHIYSVALEKGPNMRVASSRSHISALLYLADYFYEKARKEGGLKTHELRKTLDNSYMIGTYAERDKGSIWVWIMVKAKLP